MHYLLTITTMVVVLLMGIGCTENKPLDPTTKCPDPILAMDGYRIPPISERVWDVSEDGRYAAWSIKGSAKLTIVDLKEQRTLRTFDVGEFMKGSSTAEATIRDAVFLPGSAREIAVSVFLRSHDNVNASVATVVLDVVDSTYQIKMLGDCDAQGWSPTVGNYVFSEGKVKVDGKVLVRVTNGYLYDFATNVFFPPLMLNKFNGLGMLLVVTSSSGFVFAYASKNDTQQGSQSFLQVNGTAYDVSEYLNWLEPGYAVEGTDNVVCWVNLVRSDAFGENIVVLNVRKLVETGSYRAAVVKEIILQDLFCKYSYLSLHPRGLDASHMLISMHSDGDYIQRAAWIDLTTNSIKWLSDFP